MTDADTSLAAAETYIQPLVMNGLTGRMLVLPSETKKKREMLLIYGQHASIERMYTLAQELSRYGRVTLPDLPGFGGMESFYKIGQKPDLDTMADYLAAFVKLKYSRKRVTMIGVSYGFNVVTRMLQKYPELTRKVDMVVSVVGFVHYEDFHFSPSKFRLFRATTKIFSWRATAWFAQNIVLRGPMITATYKLVSGTNPKMKDADKAEQNRRIKFEIILWRINDIRTYMYTIHGMLHANLCDKPLKLPVYHVRVDGDQYFDNYQVEQHMRVIFSDFKDYPAVLGAHMPTIVANRKEIAPLIPNGIRRILSKPV